MAQITPPDPWIQVKPLLERTSALILALTVGVTVALVSIAFFEIVRFITPIWQQDLPTELTYNKISNV